MLRETKPAKQAKPSRVKYAGIMADAASLGVHRIHLYLVLSGRRESRSLLRRYRQLKRHAA